MARQSASSRRIHLFNLLWARQRLTLGCHLGEVVEEMLVCFLLLGMRRVLRLLAVTAIGFGESSDSR